MIFLRPLIKCHQDRAGSQSILSSRSTDGRTEGRTPKEESSFLGICHRFARSDFLLTLLSGAADGPTYYVGSETGYLR